MPDSSEHKSYDPFLRYIGPLLQVVIAALVIWMGTTLQTVDKTLNTQVEIARIHQTTVAARLESHSAQIIDLQKRLSEAEFNIRVLTRKENQK